MLVQEEEEGGEKPPPWYRASTPSKRMRAIASIHPTEGGGGVPRQAYQLVHKATGILKSEGKRDRQTENGKESERETKREREKRKDLRRMMT